MKTLIEKLENRKKITGKALQELFALILELEKNLDKDITTSDTSCKVNIKAEEEIKLLHEKIDHLLNEQINIREEINKINK